MSMRRVPSKTGSKDQVGKRASVSKSQASAKSSASSKAQISARSSASSKAQVSVEPSTSTTKKQKEFSLPALSIIHKPKVTESELERLKKRTIRRHAPPGEDLKHIKIILKSLKGQPTTVQEFISLIAPSTGDNGAILRTVMNDDLNSFRKLARKVYETITQDNSDVLLNQQLQLAEYYKEKKSLLHYRMMKNIEEIFMMAPNFDFERYALEKEKYLLELFPIPEELNIEPEEMEMMKRQAAFHRLQWLRSEGERLNEENNSLKKRLAQLKHLHKEEQLKMMQVEKAAEAKKEALEATQAEKAEKLEMLNQSLEKSIISQEASMRETKDAILLEPVHPKTGAVKKKKSTGAVRKKKRPAWNEQAAKEIDAQAIEESRAAETAKITSPFHFSPIKTPPPKSSGPKERSPFHYSPTESPAGAYYVSPQRQVASAPQPQSSEPQRRGRRAAAPRDSWGGFY
ncbi:unnamed protein product [Tenebrio molitor]|uniref:Uncharacterized protein n=1 Tax=Tenebrio molitor TaxID=7067 RepID=A0A8J6LGV8_TENMO|nr:hypothetical protein GEV33_010068 [Tenebrio molitor]CAH1376655.1 unnamed protein product [Tenebrio molitor]